MPNAKLAEIPQEFEKPQNGEYYDPDGECQSIGTRR